MTEVDDVSIIVVNISTDQISIDDTKSSRLDESIILEHLIRYFSKFDPLPVITITIEGPVPVVVRGYKYLLAARALARPMVRAAIEGKPSAEAVSAFLTRTGATLLNWDAIQASDERNPLLVMWHVFFFARPLRAEEKVAFNTVVMSIFENQVMTIVHDDAGPLAEFEASTPLDHVFAKNYLDAIARFDDEHARIVSYQGKRFRSP